MLTVQVVSQYDCLDEYLKVVDAFLDIILENDMVSGFLHLTMFVSYNIKKKL